MVSRISSGVLRISVISFCRLVWDFTDLKEPEYDRVSIGCRFIINKFQKVGAPVAKEIGRNKVASLSHDLLRPGFTFCACVYFHL